MRRKDCSELSSSPRCRLRTSCSDVDLTGENWGVKTVSNMLLGDAVAAHPKALGHCPILGVPVWGSTVLAPPSNAIPAIIGKCLEIFQQGSSKGGPLSRVTLWKDSSERDRRASWSAPKLEAVPFPTDSGSVERARSWDSGSGI